MQSKPAGLVPVTRRSGTWKGRAFIRGGLGDNAQVVRDQHHGGAEALLQADLDAWLHHYNHERPHLGYRNQLRRTPATIEAHEPV